MFVLLTAEFPWLTTMPGIVQELSRYVLNEQMNDKWYDFFFLQQFNSYTLWDASLWHIWTHFCYVRILT